MSFVLYQRCSCGDRLSLEALEKLSADPESKARVVSLGYLMHLLYFDFPNSIPINKDRALTIAREIFPQLESRSGSLSNHEQFILGSMYEYGLGVEINESEAVRLYTLSSNQGNSEALVFLGSCFLTGTGVQSDHTRAVDFLRLACYQNNARAQYTLGVCYEDGMGVEKKCIRGIQIVFQVSGTGLCSRSK
jgi:TPR repeat protein